MRLANFRAQAGNAESKQGDPVVVCNALYKSTQSFNCNITAAQAIALSRNLLLKAQLILDEDLEAAAVQMWNTGPASENLYCGLIKARKGGRRKKPRPDAFSLSKLPKPRGR